MFSQKPGLVLVTAYRPGNYATLFSPAGRHAFRGDYSDFNDVSRSYTWGFRYERPLRDGDRFVFATADWQIAADFNSGRFVLVREDVRIARTELGEPAHVEEDPARTRKKMEEGVVEFDAEPDALDLAVSESRVVGQPLVSVITCTYNRPEMLRAAHYSIRAQTLPDWEHLVWDNGSTDARVKDVLTKLALDEPRLRVFRSKNNVNQPARFWNNLIDRARGRYICFLDDDNTKFPRYLEVLAGTLEAKPDIDMVTCGMIMIDISGRSHPHQLNLDTQSEIERRSTVDSGAFMIRREALSRIGYFPLNIKTNEDWAMMRRAASCLRMEHLRECLTTWREHGEQRMRECQQLGNERDKVTIQGTGWSETLRAEFYTPPMDRLTESQRNVVEAASHGFTEVPWRTSGSDVAVVMMPFRLESREVQNIAAQHKTIVLMHSEDPYALVANQERVRWFLQAKKDVWVCTNDTACMESYRDLVGQQVVVCSSLSVDTRASMKCTPMFERPHAVTLVGYAYPSRIKFVKELIEHIDPEIKLHLRGDGWRQAGFAASPTASFLETSAEYAETKAIVCLHRQDKDCGGSPHDAALVQRGYVEGSRGARVFIDTTRPDHSFDPGDVVWFDGPKDLASKLEEFLALASEEQEALAAPLMRRSQKDFTYRTRIERVLNAVRSLRYEAVIP